MQTITPFIRKAIPFLLGVLLTCAQAADRKLTEAESKALDSSLKLVSSGIASDIQRTTDKAVATNKASGVAIANRATKSVSTSAVSVDGSSATDDALAKQKAFANATLQATQGLLGKPPADIASMAVTQRNKTVDVSREVIERMAPKIKNLVKQAGAMAGGIEQEEETLYYFLSFDMPLELMRSYAIEAMWTKGQIVFRGVPKDTVDLQDWLRRYAVKLMYGKSNQISMGLDPKLYDYFNVTTAPTIVYTNTTARMDCAKEQAYVYPKEQLEVSANGEQKKVVKDRTLTETVCDALDPKEYYKISGAVTSQYALEQFKEHGANVDKYLDRIRFAYKEHPPKEQIRFAERWEDVITEMELKEHDVQESLAREREETIAEIRKQWTAKNQP